RLAGMGATVVCVARTASDLAETTRAAAGCSGLCVDIAGDGAAAAMVAAVLERHGRLDLLVHAAGALSAGTVEGVPPREVERLFRVNVLAPVALTQAALPDLRRARGQIVFVNSSIVRAANLAGRSLYAATKAALRAVADGVRDEENGAGVRVVSVMPGTTATPGQAAMFAAADRPCRPERLLQADDVAQTVCSALSMPDTAELTELFVRPMLAP
uniref:SDR family NAD(P)-dependent oxidoreductase n=1 Tax=Sphingomonas bacterium TaxID=1895847 RepID=UPI00157636AE